MIEPVRRRYFTKLLGNLLSGGGAFLSQVLLTRALGPSLYGQFAYLQAHFEQIAGTLDFGASTTYFTQISQERNRYRAASAVYLVFLGLVVLLVGLYLFTTYVGGWSSTVWPSISISAVIWAAVLGFAIYTSRVSVQITDAAGLSRRTETFRVLRALGTLLLLLALYVTGSLTLTRALAVIAISYLAFSIFCVRFGHRVMGGGSPDFSPGVLRTTAKSFWSYGKPLAFYSIMVVGFTLFERWLLQASSGATQQGYFGIAQQLSLTVFVLANSLTPIFHRESAVAFSAGNFSALRVLFSTYTRRFFALAAVPSIFIALNAKSILGLLSGVQYEEGWPVVALMALYPLHQTTGMLSVTMQFATNRTRSYLVIGIIRDVVGFFLGYFLIAPRHWAIPGLELGAVGLAIKFLVCQFLNTNLMHRSNCKYLELSFRSQLMRECVLMLALGLLALVGALLGGFLWPGGDLGMRILRLISSGSTYLTLVLGTFWFFPTAFGMSSKEKSQVLEFSRHLVARLGLFGSKRELGPVDQARIN